MFDKSYLNLEETAKFINQYGYEFSVENASSDINFKKLLIDLQTELKLNILFYFKGYIKTEVERVFENMNIPYNTLHTDGEGYFFLERENLINSFLNNEPMIFKKSSLFRPFSFLDNPIYYEPSINFKYDWNFDYFLSEGGDYTIDMTDICLSKEQLLKIFDYEKSDSFKNSVQVKAIRGLQEKIRVLEDMNKDYKDMLESVFGSELTIKSEQSYLVTIGILLELLQKPKLIGKENIKIFPSQAKIIEEIISNFDIYGQKKANLETRFSNANEHLDQALKAKLAYPKK